VRPALRASRMGRRPNSMSMLEAWAGRFS
jgi:hypothetical protein